MDRIKIFEDIAQIVTTDYAGAEELKYPTAHLSFLRFCAQMAEQHEFEDEHLYNFVQLYLQVIGDRKLTFDVKEYPGFHHYDRGFSVRSDGTDLYITDVDQAEQLQPGDKILKINNYSPASFRSVTTLMQRDHPMTERDLWEAYLNHARVIYVEHEDGAQEKVILQKFTPIQPHPVVTFQRLDGESAYLRIESFAEDEPIQRLVDDHQEILASCKKLILDLRRNTGGFQSAFLPLLPYVCDRDMTVADFLAEEQVYTRYSERNCDLSKKQMASYTEHEDPNVREMAQAIVSDLETNRGCGLLLDESEKDDELINSCRSAEKVILLTDTFCEDEAEWFALACSRLQGVTLVGRPTMGNMDYSNLVTVDYGYGTTFTYPISKTKSCFEGKGYNNWGVPVNIYIPWMKEEIEEDILLKTALTL